MKYSQLDVFNEINATGTFGRAWEIMKRYFIDVLLIVLILFLIQLPLDSFDEEYFHLPMLGTVYYLFLYGPVKYGVALAFLQIVRGNKFRIETVLSVFRRNYLNVLLAAILTDIIIGIGLVLLIVPGIIFAVRLVFVPYLTTDKNMDAVSAIKESWEMTRHHSWTIFVMGLLSIPVFIAGIIVLGVGVVVSVMWIGVAFALVYHRVAGQLKPAGSLGQG